MAISFTYAGDPGQSTLARLRFLAGDTGPVSWLLTDQEITAQYTISGGIYSTAATLCYALAARFATQVSNTIAAAGIAEQTSDMHRHYLALAQRYATMATVAGESGTGGGTSSAVITAPFVGGVDAGEMNDVDTDADRPLPAFSSSARVRLPYSTWRP